MRVILRYVLAVLVVQFVSCAVLPVDKCKLEDSACMTQAFQKALPIFVEGIPELGVEVMDVMNLDDIAFDLSGLQFTLKEGKLKGLKTTVIENVKWNTKKKTMDVVFHLDALVKGHYTAGGRLLILPITGDGQMKLKLKNVQIKLILNYEMENDHVVPTKYTFTFDVRDNAHFSLTNLFNGNKQLSDTMLTFLNENWKQVSEEFGRPVMNACAKIIYKNVKNYFANQPISEIAEF